MFIVLLVEDRQLGGGQYFLTGVEEAGEVGVSFGEAGKTWVVDKGVELLPPKGVIRS